MVIAAGNSAAQATADVERYGRFDEHGIAELARWVAAEVAGGISEK